MTTVKTEVEFRYEPLNFLEAVTSLQLQHGQLTLDGGKALYVLSSPIDPIPDPLLQELRQ